MDEAIRLLLVEDDPAIVEIVRVGMSYEGIGVEVAGDGLEAVRLHRDLRPDIVVLDLMLPRMEGLEALRRMRLAGPTPVIVLTARDAPGDRVAGLEAGADDYVTKPFHFPELVARIRAVLRRDGRSDRSDVIEVGDLRLDVGAREVTRGGRAVQLTPRQFEVLRVLAANARRVLSKDQIFEAAWGLPHLGDPNLVEQQVHGIRERVDRGHPRPLIHTVRGVGYVLREEGG